MDIKFNCECGQSLEIDSSASGQTIECPTCHAPILVPLQEIRPVAGLPITQFTLDNNLNSNDIVEAVEKVKVYLTPQETLSHICIQSKIAAKSLFPDILAATSRRLILLDRKFLGQINMVDFLWVDILDIQISEQLMGATITFIPTSRIPFFVKGLPKVAARKLYTYAQGIEEEMRLYRHKLHLETLRASSNQINIQNTAGT